MRKKLRIIVAGLLALCLAVAGLSVVRSASAGNLVAAAVSSAADADSAAVVKGANGTLDVRRDPNEGVKAAVNGQGVSISLPYAKSASAATRLSNGAVTYASASDSANTVVPTSSGVQMLTTIKSAAAPEQYAYGVTLPPNGTVKMAADGHADVVVASKVIATVAAPWAFDANGQKVPTHFTTNGHALTQVVDHTGGHYAYPIVADPKFSWHWWGVEVRYSRGETNAIALGAGAAAAYFGWTGAAGLVAWAASPAAAWAAQHGYCLAIRFNYYRWPNPSPGYYRC